MTWDARQAAFKEQEAWVKACLAALCSAYGSCYGPSAVTRGARTEELCSHTWCHGILDVLNRAYGNEHVSYRMPEERDAAMVNPLAGP